MEQGRALVEQIKAARALGRTPETIYLELLQRGLTVAAIQEAFEAAEAPAETVRTRTVRTILGAAALLIAAGVFSFVAANWEAMPRGARLGLIALLMLAANVAGWYLRERTRFVSTGEALVVLGTLVYGAGIFLVAQMFQVRASWPDGFMLWLIGALAMAGALRSRPLFAVAAPIGFVALVGHPLVRFTGLREDALLFTPSLLLLVTAGASYLTGWALTRVARAG